MNITANPGVDKSDFELWSLAVSAINSCGTCINNAHEKAFEGGERAGRDDPDGRALCSHHSIGALALEAAAADCRLPPRRRDGLEHAFRGLAAALHRGTWWRPAQPARTLFRSNYSILLVAGAGIEPATYGL
jgi:AhpD family alkylhydroperoxidase